MLTSLPLTLTLSPSDGEREQQSTRRESISDLGFPISLADQDRFLRWLTMILPLPFGRGEGRGEGTFYL
jgi:hypothetical protein